MAKTALVTGASSGIGREIARDLSARGFRVILSARREERLRELAEELGDNTRVIVCDVSDREECLRLYEETKSEKISVLVNCAGFGAVGSFDKLPLDTELKMIDTNVTAVHARAEEFAAKHREQYDFAVSRAVAQLNVLAELSLPLVKQGGAFIAMKSKDTDEELERAKKAIRLLGGEIEKIIDYTIPHTEITHRLVVIRKKNHTPKQYPRPFRKISASPL